MSRLKQKNSLEPNVQDLMAIVAERKRLRKFIKLTDPIAKMTLGFSVLAMTVLGYKYIETHYMDDQRQTSFNDNRMNERKLFVETVFAVMDKGIISKEIANNILEEDEKLAELTLDVAIKRYNDGFKQLESGYIDQVTFDNLMADPDLIATRDWLAFNEKVFVWLEKLEQEKVLCEEETVMLKEMHNPLMMVNWVNSNKADLLGSRRIDF
jgi:hypothetical protein